MPINCDEARDDCVDADDFCGNGDDDEEALDVDEDNDDEECEAVTPSRDPTSKQPTTSNHICCYFMNPRDINIRHALVNVDEQSFEHVMSNRPPSSTH